MVVGYQLHRQAGLNVGDTVTLLGREFKITETYPERGTADDSTAWVNLAEAQEMLGMQNLVNAILALECNCATVDRIAEIRNDIAKHLAGDAGHRTRPAGIGPRRSPQQSPVGRRDSAVHEQAAGKEALQREAAGRQLVEKQTQDFAAVLVPVVMIGCGVWIGFLALMNVRQRSNEIGILRAIGLKSTQILLIFLGKAILIGLAGACHRLCGRYTLSAFPGAILRPPPRTPRGCLNRS